MDVEPRTVTSRRRAIFLLAATVLVLLWQATFFAAGTRLPSAWRLEGATGAHQDFRFLYFLYHAGLYPIATTDELTDFSREGAERLLSERGSTLVTEVSETLRFGELGQTYLYLPKAWLTGSAARPTMRPTHAAAFAMALVAVLWSVSLAGQPVLAGALVVLVGSNPFQLYETYAHENVFSWSITCALLVLAMLWPFVVGPPRPHRMEWAAAVAAGVLLGLVRQVRSEPTVLVGSAAIVFATLRGRSWVRRAALAALVVVTTFATANVAVAALKAERAEAERVVREAGGRVYEGPRDDYHSVWNTIWCGLGDFGASRGYGWSDFAAFAYAKPIMRERYGIEMPTTRDELIAPSNREGGFHRAPVQFPHYEDVLREKVVRDVTDDPLWYAGVLGRRALVVLGETTPLGVAVGAWALRVPFPGWLALALLVGYAALRRWELVKLVLFAAPLSATAVLAYSGGGTAWLSCYHTFAAAAAVHLLAERWSARRRRRQATGVVEVVAAQR